MNSEWVTRDEARSIIRKYCAYQERSHREVCNRLRKLSIPEEWIDEFVVELIEENYLNEARFAGLYARSKVNQKKWGKTKVKNELIKKGVSKKVIEEALEEINEEVYQSNLKYWIEKKELDVGRAHPGVRRQKIIRFCLSKGYEYQDVISALEAGFDER